jgi:hypothetical protein
VKKKMYPKKFSAKIEFCKIGPWNPEPMAPAAMAKASLPFRPWNQENMDWDQKIIKMYPPPIRKRTGALKCPLFPYIISIKCPEF